MPENDDILLSQTQLAARLGVSERTVQRLVRRGAIPYERVGNTPVFRLSLLDEVLSHRSPASSRIDNWIDRTD